MCKILFFFLFLTQIIFAESVNIYNEDDIDDDYDFYAKVSSDFSNGSFSINTELSTTYGKDSASPIYAYIPFNDGTSSSYSIQAPSLIPNIETEQAKLIMIFDVENSSDIDRYLRVAWYDSSNDEYVYINSRVMSSDLVNEISSGGTFTTSDERDAVFLEIDLSSLASESESCDSAWVCDSDFDTDILVFLSDTNESTGNAVTLTDEKVATGVSFKLYLSSSVNTTAPVLETLEKGDARAFAQITSASISDYYQTAIYSSGTLLELVDGFNGSTEVTVKGLTNGMTYSLSFALVDKYYFATPQTAAMSVTPESIEVFLKETSCFLVTAGFQREHYVLRYFRNFRDNVLLKNSLGKSFVDFYYSFSPEMAKTIIASPFLSKMIRSVSYVIYFLMNYIWVGILFFLFLTFFGLKLIFKIKIRFFSNGEGYGR